VLRSTHQRPGQWLHVGSGGALPVECQSPCAGGGEASGASASRGHGLGGGVGWRPVAAAAASWAGDGVEGGGRRGVEGGGRCSTEDVGSGLAT
jgi:hypothetical protein